jgi:hypothetical protein
VLAAASAAHAETLYVVEQVVVNVNSAPDATGERIATIKSGDAVEVLDRQGDQVHVHLANGTEGWVRKSYLATDEPLHVRLAERTSRSREAQTGCDATGGRVGGGERGSAPETRHPANQHRHDRSTAPPAARPRPRRRRQHRPQRPPLTEDPAAREQPAHEPPYFMTPPDSPARPVWHWALGSFVVALGLGFALGWSMLDRRIRRKYGGLRIYLTGRLVRGCLVRERLVLTKRLR